MNIEQLNVDIRSRFHSAGAKGSGIVFAVLDTGVKEVGSLIGRVEGDTKDTKGHGTSVAGILLEWCPGATVRSYRVLPGGSGCTENIIAALRDVLARAKREPIRQYIVNMSLSGTYSPKDALVAQYRQAIDALVEFGIPVIVAAGNDGRQAMYKYPSCFEAPITVSAITSAAKKANFTTFHNEVDFAEHGVKVRCMTLMGATTTKNGTSFACPIVAGKAGLLMSAYRRDTGKWMPEPMLYYELRMLSLDLGVAGKDKYFGHGWPDIRTYRTEA